MSAGRIVSIVLRGDVKGFIGPMTAAEASVKDLRGRMLDSTKEAKSFREGLTSVGNAAGKAGLVATAGIALITKAAMDWESAWAGVTKTVDGTPAQLAAIEDGLQKMSAVKPTTAVELAAIAESAGALGVKREDLLSFTSVMADLGETTNLTSEDAATSIAQLMNVMQTAPEDVDNLGAALVDLGNKGASTERQIIEMAQNIAGAGAIVGLSEANVLALGNALASSGIDAEAGGSAISNVMIDIDKSVSTGSDKLDQFAKVAGLSAEDFAAKWEAAPADAIATFVEGLGRMNSSGEDVFSTLKALGQSDIRVTRALLNMAASGDMLRESLANGDAAWGSNTALAEEAAKRYDTTAAKTKMAWNEITAAAVDAGEVMLPVVAGIAEAVSGIAGAFSSLPAPVKGGVTAIGGVAAVGLLAVGGVSKLVNTVVGAREALDKLAIHSPKAAGALGRVGKAAGLASVALGGVAIAGAVFENADKWNVGGVNEFTKALLDAADGSDVLLGKLSSKDSSGLFGWNRNSIDGIADAFDKAAEGAGKMDLSFGHDSSWERGSRLVDQVDASLSALVSSGSGDRAAEIFDYLAQSTDRSEKSLLSLLPQYKDGLSAVEVQTDLTGDAAEGMAGSLDGAVDSMGRSAEELKAIEDAARDTAASFFDITGGADAADLSLAQWTQRLRDQAKALRDFTKNSQEAGKKGLEEGLIAELQAAGPEGARMMSMLAGATKKEIAAANKAWESGQIAISDYIDMTGEVPPSVGTKVTISGVDYVLEQINKLNEATRRAGKGVHYTAGYGGGQTMFTGGQVPPGYASGGKVPGTPPSDPTIDNVLAFGATTKNPIAVRSGEWIINEEQSKRNDRWLAAINSGLNIDDIITGYADGGKVSKLDIMKQQQAVRDIQRSLDEREKYGKKPKKGKDTRKSRYVVRGLDRRVMQGDLEEAKQDLRDLKSGKAEKLEKAEQAKEQREKVAADKAAAAAELETTRLSAKSSFADNFDIGGLSSTAAVDRHLERMSADSAMFVGLLRDLKKKDASPWLLSQLVEAGPTPGAIRLARQYATDSAALARVNAQTAEIDSISNSYAGLVTDPRFMQAGAWNSGTATGASRTYNINAYAPAETAREFERLIRFNEMTAAAGGGI